MAHRLRHGPLKPENPMRGLRLHGPSYRLEILRGYLADKSPDDWALRPGTTHGKGIYRYDFHAPYNLFLAEKKMRWVTAHVVRHTFASLLAQSGTSIFKIAAWLGDGVDVTQRHYAHLSPQDDDLESGIEIRHAPSGGGELATPGESALATGRNLLRRPV